MKISADINSHIYTNRPVIIHDITVIVFVETHIL